MLYKSDNKNLLLNQIHADGHRNSVKETKPVFYDKSGDLFALTYGKAGTMMWYPFIDGAYNINDTGYNIFDKVEKNKIRVRTLEAGKNIKLSYTNTGCLKIDASISEITAPSNVSININDVLNLFEESENIKLEHTENNKLKILSTNESSFINKYGKIQNTELYYKNGRLGVGRKPLYNYKLDIDIPVNKSVSGIHAGDGTYGFSLGNGTDNGFIPQILGMSAQKDDAGLYLVGRAGKPDASNIPLIVLDGRNNKDGKLSNRPILGVTSSEYDSYNLLLDHLGRLGINKVPRLYNAEIAGKIQADDFVLPNNLSLSDLYTIIESQNYKIQKLQELVEFLVSKM